METLRLLLRSGLSALAFAAAAIPAATTSEAAVLRREAIEPGDTVLADNLVPGESDEYLLDLPRGAVAALTVSRAGPGGWRPRFGLFTDAFAPVAFEPTPPLRTTPLPVSGTYHLIVGGAQGTVGGYRVRVGVAPQRSAAASGSGDAAPAPLVLGAFEGSVLDVTIRWKGPAAVTLASFSGPDAAPLGGAGGAQVRGSVSVQRGFVAAVRGDQTAVFDVPPGTSRWSASIRVRPPRLAGATRDLRTTAVPERPTVDLPFAGSLPVVRLLDEAGGPNDVFFTGGTSAPGAFAFAGEETGPCGLLGDPDDPTRFELRCRNGHSARIEDVVRDGGGRITSFEALDVRSPRGTGSASFSGFEYDPSTGLPTAWREVRRFDATGGVHDLRVSGVRRLGNGSTSAYVLVHTGPDGVPRTYQFGFDFQ